MMETDREVTDRDIERIIEENEPGVADAMAAYERVATPYFAAVTPEQTGPVYTTTTTSAPASS
jgi:hypothetical protein